MRGLRVDGAVTLADLVHSHVVTPVAKVRRDDLQQAAEQTLAQDGVLAGEWIRDTDRAPGGPLIRLGCGGAVIWHRKQFDHARRDQRRRDDLAEPGPHEHLPDRVADLHRLVAMRRHGGARQGGRHSLIAADPDDLFGDVRLDDQIAAPGRHGREPGLGVTAIDDERLRPGRNHDPGAARCGLRLDPDTGEEAALLVGVELGPEQAIDPSRPVRNARRRWFDRVGVDRARRDGPASPLGHETGGPVRADPGEAGLQALLEAQAGIGTQGVAERRLADVHRVEDRRFDDDLRRPLRDLRPGATHDARDRDGPDPIGDDQGLGIKHALDMVERLEAFTGARSPNDDPAFVHARRIECVDRLAELHHDVVGGVDDVADRPLARGQQAHLDPVRRRPDPDAAHPAADEARTELGIEDLDLQALRGMTARLDHVGRWQAQRPAGHGCHLAGEPDDREGVAAVRFDVDVEDDVAIQLCQWTADRRPRGQDEDPVGIGGQPEFVARAQHPVADDAHLLSPLDAPVPGQDRAGQGHRDSLAGRDVGRATDDVERFAGAHVDTGQRQPVSARMALDAEQLPHHDVAPVHTPRLEPTDLHAQQGQSFGQGFRTQVDVDEFTQPGEWHSHRNCSRNRRSLSRKRRRSVIPCLSILIRSGPIPNAKPW